MAGLLGGDNPSDELVAKLASRLEVSAQGVISGAPQIPAPLPSHRPCLRHRPGVSRGEAAPTCAIIGYAEQTGRDGAIIDYAEQTGRDGTPSMERMSDAAIEEYRGIMAKLQPAVQGNGAADTKVDQASEATGGIIQPALKGRGVEVPEEGGIIVGPESGTASTGRRNRFQLKGPECDASTSAVDEEAIEAISLLERALSSSRPRTGSGGDLDEAGVAQGGVQDPDGHGLLEDDSYGDDEHAPRIVWGDVPQVTARPPSPPMGKLASPNAKNGKGSTSLHLVAAASPNAKNGKGSTPLHLVAAAGSLPGLILLIEHGADVDAIDAAGRTALHVACGLSGGEALVRRLLDAGADPGPVDDAGDTPLHCAAAQGCEGCVRLLLQHGAASGVSNLSGDTPLHQAAVRGHLGVMQQLILGPSSPSSRAAAKAAGEKGSAEKATAEKAQVILDKQAADADAVKAKKDANNGERRAAKVALAAKVQADKQAALARVEEALADEEALDAVAAAEAAAVAQAASKLDFAAAKQAAEDQVRVRAAASASAAHKLAEQVQSKAGEAAAAKEAVEMARSAAAEKARLAAAAALLRAETEAKAMTEEEQSRLAAAADVEERLRLEVGPPGDSDSDSSGNSSSSVRFRRRSLQRALSSVLPPGWSVVIDPMAERPLFTCLATGESTWDTPIKPASWLQSSSAPSSAPLPLSFSSSSSSDGSPPPQRSVASTLLGEFIDPKLVRPHTAAFNSSSEVAYLSYSSDSTLEATDEMFADTGGGTGETAARAVDLWTRCWTEDGSVYFVSQATGESTWDEPCGVIVDQMDAEEGAEGGWHLGEPSAAEEWTERGGREDEAGEAVENTRQEWVEKWDYASKSPYWVSTWTEEATWERPAEAPCDEEVQGAEWMESWDDDGVIFWVNTATGEATYDAYYEGVMEGLTEAWAEHANDDAATGVTPSGPAGASEERFDGEAVRNASALESASSNHEDGGGRTLEVWNRFFENALLSNLPRNSPAAVDAAKGDSALLNAVIAGFKEEVERLLSGGVPANCADAQRRSPLHYAAYSGDRALAALLCDFDAEIEATDASGNTPLHVAAARGSTDSLLLLLEYAAAPDAVNDVGDSPLHLATWFGNHECVKHLLDYKASATLPNALGLDPYANVISRSPLAKKKKLPSDLRKALALLVHHSQPALLSHKPSSIPPAEVPVLQPDSRASPLRSSTGSMDDFHDCEDGPP